MKKPSNALRQLQSDHREVKALLRRCEQAEDERGRERLCAEIIHKLKIHMRIEEEVFYPYLRQGTDRVDLAEEAEIEHTAAKSLIEKLERNGSGGLKGRALVHVLTEYLDHHIREEEESIFPTIEDSGVDLEALGLELNDRREAIEQGKAQPSKRGNGARDTARERRTTQESNEQLVEEHAGHLSRSARNAKWINSPEESEDRPGQTLATRNPEVIRRWAEERHAMPATTPEGDAEHPRVLRFDFPEYDKGLRHVDWEAWLKTFEERQLVFLFQEHMKRGNPSNFFQIENPNRQAVAA